MARIGRRDGRGNLTVPALLGDSPLVKAGDDNRWDMELTDTSGRDIVTFLQKFLFLSPGSRPLARTLVK